MMQKTELHADGALLRIVPTIRPSAGGNARVVRSRHGETCTVPGCAVGVDVRKYVPEMLDYGTPITIRHLLTHASGLRDQWNLLALACGALRRIGLRRRT